jgi:hypothetical protein
MAVQKYAHGLSFADAAARLAYVPSPGDANKVAKQFDDNSYWVLTSVEPVQWSPMQEVAFANLGGQTKVIYVRTAGDDKNDGTSVGQALATLPKAFEMVAKDFWNGFYVIDITGMTISDPINFPQVRSGSFIASTEDLGFNDDYGAVYRSAVNIRATPTIIGALPTVDTEITTRPGVIRLDCTTAAPAWTVDEHKGRFLRSTAALSAMEYLVIGNGVDYIDVVNGTTSPLNYPCEIVELGAVFAPDAVDELVCDGLIGGYTFYGIRFNILEDQAFAITNCTSLTFESCAFWSGRTRTGGLGVPRFMRCFFESTTYAGVRFTGGAMEFIHCAAVGINGLFSYGSIQNGMGDVINPVASAHTLIRCFIEYFGEMGTSCYPAAVFMSGTVIEQPMSGGLLGSRITIDGANSVINGLWVDSGSYAHVASNGTPAIVLDDPTVGPGGTMLIKADVTITGDITVGATVVAAGTLVSGWQVVEHAARGAKCIIERP